MTEELNKYKKDLPNGVKTDDYAALDFIRAEDGDAVATKYEKLLDAREKLRGDYQGAGFRNNPIEKDIKKGKEAYRLTKGEIEARQTEARRNMTQEELDAKRLLKNQKRHQSRRCVTVNTCRRK